MKVTLGEWLEGIVSDDLDSVGVSFWELLGAPSGPSDLTSLARVSAEAIRAVESTLRLRHVERASWIPFVELILPQSAALDFSLPNRSMEIRDISKASLRISKTGAAFFWGSWEAYQVTRRLDDEGYPEFRVVKQSCINDRDMEFSWDQYRNKLYILESETLYR